MSVCGTIWWGYFFAFHFLNIVYNNEMLQRVIQAITLNGEYNVLILQMQRALRV